VSAKTMPLVVTRRVALANRARVCRRRFERTLGFVTFDRRFPPFVHPHRTSTDLVFVYPWKEGSTS